MVRAHHGHLATGALPPATTYHPTENWTPSYSSASGTSIADLRHPQHDVAGHDVANPVVADPFKHRRQLPVLRQHHVALDGRRIAIFLVLRAERQSLAVLGLSTSKTTTGSATAEVDPIGQRRARRQMRRDSGLSRRPVS